MPINNLIYRIASFVCHQHPESTFIAGGNLLPLCARCTGIYTGFLISFLFVMITAGKKKLRCLDKKVYLLSAIILSVFILEGFLSLRKMLATPNLLKFLLGLSGGTALGIFSFALLNRALSPKECFTKARFSLKNFCSLAFIMLAIFSSRAFLNFPFSFYFWITLSFGGLLFTYILVNLTVVAVFLGGNTRKRNFRIQLGLYTALLLAAESFLLYLLLK